MRQIDIIDEFISSYEGSRTKEEALLVIKEFFQFTKEQMIDLQDIRCKYLGTFLIYPGRAKGMIDFLRRKNNKGVLSDEKFEEIVSKIKEMLATKHNINLDEDEEI